MKIENIATSTAVINLPGGWSSRTLNFLGKAPFYTTSRLYLYQITHNGTGLQGLPGVGPKMFAEIRRKLISCGLPDLNEQVFGYGYDSVPRTKAILRKMLEAWPTATRVTKRSLRTELAAHQAD